MWYVPILVLVLIGGCSDGANDSGPGVPLPPAPAQRSIDGSENNPVDSDLGRAGSMLVRQAPAQFADGVGAQSGLERPNPRAISNIVCDQSAIGDRPSASGATDFVWQWGQFLDHDLSHSRERAPEEPMPIGVPPGDPQFDPNATGAHSMEFLRSAFGEGTGETTPREQLNALSAFIDAGNVYGSDEIRAGALRALDGSGRLLIGDDDLLPRNRDGLPNLPSPSDGRMFLAGDLRVNVQIALTALHTLFVREHNRQAEILAAAAPGLDGEAIYQRARAHVGALMQIITYEQWLPVILGEPSLSPYEGYDPDVSPQLMNEFTTVAFRFGHSMLSPQLLRLGADMLRIPEGPVPLRDAYFAPTRLSEEGGIEPLLRGLATQVMQAVDPFLIDEVRNFLFGPPEGEGRDLCALNLQRGRDHGLPDYNSLRAAFGLPAKPTIEKISSDPETQSRLRAAYGDVSLIDPWVGALAEDHLPGALVGELIAVVLRRQFEALRDGDRYFYLNTKTSPFAVDELNALRATRLVDVIRRNTTIGNEIQDDVFRVKEMG